ncbi:protein S40-7-like isoform X3 [Magnolia sinica]|uniref:protein S40-7-like isoform X3 n=1 Tax=Magnolia sinica TaxID=86752 RepID=UPI00265A467B|nr:protein S40-7-like isoform X3 [Magnolia sinica]
MESTVTSSSSSPFRHQKSPSSGRFLGLFSEPSITSVGPTSGIELDEDDVFWSDASCSDASISSRRSETPPPPPSPSENGVARFRRPQNFGILAALPDTAVHRHDRGPFLRRPIAASPPSSSRMIPSIPRPQPLTASGKFHQSAPVNVPMLPMAAGRREDSEGFEEGDDREGDDEMLPPHEIVARGSARSPMTTFSVLEGKGRTLKGRDLRRVRNAVFQKTGLSEKRGRFQWGREVIRLPMERMGFCYVKEIFFFSSFLFYHVGPLGQRFGSLNHGPPGGI